VVPALGLRSVVLDIEEGNIPSMRLAERLGADRRSPTRLHPGRAGELHTMVVYVLGLVP
jgi:RimJ/RimL family protein N-acetyltransferase